MKKPKAISTMPRTREAPQRRVRRQKDRSFRKRSSAARASWPLNVRPNIGVVGSSGFGSRRQSPTRPTPASIRFCCAQEGVRSGPVGGSGRLRRRCIHLNVSSSMPQKSTTTAGGAHFVFPEDPSRA